MLIEQSRYDLAEGEFRKALSEDPDDAFAHAWLAMCVVEREAFDEATHEANCAIELAPDDDLPYYALAIVMSQRNRLQEAEQAICEAIRIDPEDERFYGCLARIYLDQGRWQEAIETADRGLMIDAADGDCMNLRSMALVKLGRMNDANQTIERALQQNPNDALSHANRGWILLDRGETAKALEHFREALRNDPTLDWARQGITRALKARYFIYRIVSSYFFKMSKLSPTARWAIAIGGLLVMHTLLGLADTYPVIAPFVWTVLIAYVAFVVLTWIADPLFNLLLRLNRYGRMALSREQVITSNCVCGLLSIALCGLVAFAIFQSIAVLFISAFCGLMIPSVSRIYDCEPGWPRMTLAIAVAISSALGVVALLAFYAGLLMAPPFGNLLLLIAVFLTVLFGIGALGSQLAANFLRDVVVVK